MTEEKYRLADVTIKAVSAIVGITIAVYGVLQYVESARQNRATQSVEQQKLLIEKAKLAFELNRQKSEILGRAAQVASAATWASDSKERLKAIDSYFQLLVGELSLVANRDVIAKGDSLNESLTRIGRTKPTETAGETIDALNAFVQACRTQITKDFQGNLNLNAQQPAH